MTFDCKQKEAFITELFETVPNSLYNDFFFFFFFFFFEKQDCMVSEICCYLTLLYSDY